MQRYADSLEKKNTKYRTLDSSSQVTIKSLSQVIEDDQGVVNLHLLNEGALKEELVRSQKKILGGWIKGFVVGVPTGIAGYLLLIRK